MRGRYAINNKIHLTDIIYEMTNKEKKLIMECNFEKCWLELWGSATNCYYKNEKTFAKEKFNMLMKGVHIKNEYYNSKSLIKESEALWDTPEWGFPKGRKNQYETNKDCALREWTEETGLPSNTVEIVENVLPYNEYVIGSNYQSYRDTYYIGKYKGEIDEVLSYQKIEISDARWASLEETKSLIRPYHKERLGIIDRVDTVLRKWILA
jgi:8-oxo-dGTP pyrophosphatase MutT (NUDIX family)